MDISTLDPSSPGARSIPGERNMPNRHQPQKRLTSRVLLWIVLAVLFATSAWRWHQLGPQLKGSPRDGESIKSGSKIASGSKATGTTARKTSVSPPNAPLSLESQKRLRKFKRLKDAIWVSGDIKSKSDLPQLYASDPTTWSKAGKVKVCVFSRTPRQDSLFRTQVISMFGSGKYSYSVLSSTSCQHLGTCVNGDEARTHPDCDPSSNPTVRLVERVKCCHHDRFDKVLQNGMKYWDIVYVTGDEFCQTTHISGKAHFRSYFGSQVSRVPMRPLMPTTLPLGPRAEFKRVRSTEVQLASDRTLLFNFVGSITSPSRKVLAKYIKSISDTLDSKSHFTHFVPKWHKELTEENGYVLPDQYREIVLQSKFTLCPLGRNPEAYRIYEACEAGSIPVVVVDDMYAKHECKDSFRPIFDSGAPFVILNTWQGSVQLLQELASDTEYITKLQASVMEWYKGFMTDAAKVFESKMEQRFVSRVNHKPEPTLSGAGSVFWPDTQPLLND